uniref:Uncharacterized protein n=1 Tax=Ciona savignyi TaxID=51511 RepID=H2YNT2_CIOSA
TESSDVTSDSDLDKNHQKSKRNAPFEFSTAIQPDNPTPPALITDSQSNSDKDDDINQQSSESSISSKRDKTPEIIEFDDNLPSVSALESSGILVEEPVSEKTVFFDSLDEETDSTSHSPQSVEVAPAVSKMVEFNMDILPEFDNLIQGTPGGELADVMPTRQQVELEMMSKWETQGGATILDVSNLSLADLDESDEPDDEPTEQNEACDLIVFDEEPGFDFHPSQREI